MKTSIIKDPDGNIIETGIIDMIESKGLEFTYDAEGNIMLVKRPNLKANLPVRYTVQEAQNEDNAPWKTHSSRLHTGKVPHTDDSQSEISGDPDNLAAGFK